jgi:hypothetical protein
MLSFLSLIQGLCLLTTAFADIIPADAANNISWPYHAYKTANFTPPYLAISRSTQYPSVDPNTTSNAYLFFSPAGGTPVQKAPVIMSDVTGDLVWNGLNQTSFAFGVQTYRGEQVLVLWNGTSFPEPIGRGNGLVHLYNKNYELIAEVTLPGNFLENNSSVTYSSNIDLHEIFITEKNTLIVTANNVTQTDLTSVGGAEDGWVVEAQVYEIDIATNNILFTWKSLDHLDKLPLTASVYPLGSEGYNGTTQALAWGYFHINAASPYLDGGYILSSRYLASAIALDSTGEVLWHLQGVDGGDFTLGEGVDFRYQHHIRIIPDQSNTSSVTIRLFDNHNCPIDNGTVAATGKLLAVDLATKHVSLIQQFLNSTGPIYPTAQGSFEPMANGNYFKGNGWIPVLEEFSPAGEILSTIQFGNATIRPGGGYVSSGRGTLSYRGFKQPWIGCPKTKPSVVVERTENGTMVYVSWNGATEVVGWRVYGGSQGTWNLMTEAQKIGFETEIEVGEVESVYVQAVLLEGVEDCCGEVDGVSDVVIVDVSQDGCTDD